MKIEGLVAALLSAMVACSSNGVEEDMLKLTSELSASERLKWRRALDFPKNCFNGVYEWDDESHPRIEFLEISFNRTIVYNLCDLSNNRVNLFKVAAHTPEAKPLLLKFKEMIEVDGPVLDSGWADERTTSDNLKSYAARFQEIVEYKARWTSLLDGAFSIDSSGRLVVDRRSNAAGTCGTYSVYSLNEDQPVLVEFRAQSSCHGGSDIKQWKSYPKDYIDGVASLD